MWVNRIFKYTRVKDDRSNDDDYKSVMPEWQVMKTHLNDVEMFRSFILDDMLLMMLNNHRLSHFELDYLCPPPLTLSLSCSLFLMWSDLDGSEWTFLPNTVCRMDEKFHLHSVRCVLFRFDSLR